MKSPNLISSIKDHIDLAEVVEQAGVDLNRRGSRYVGLCPFHDDKTPSFYVFDDRHFKCFGCGEYGDAIDFVEKLHGCDFNEALKILGIENGPVSADQQAEFKKLKHRRELVKSFRRWERDAADEAALLCRSARKVLHSISTEADLDTYGDFYHALPLWEYHLDILSCGDNEAKLALFRSKHDG
jgi:DNA primase